MGDHEDRVSELRKGTEQRERDALWTAQTASWPLPGSWADNELEGASSVAQRLRVCRTMRGTQV